MRKLLLLLALASGTTAFAQMDIGVFGMRASSPHTSFASGWGGGINIFSRPLGQSDFYRTLPVKFQVGVTGYVSGAGRYELTRVGTGAPQNVWAQTVFNNVHFGFYGDMRFSLRQTQNRVVPYLDLFGGIRSLYAKQNNIQYTDASAITLSRYTGISGGFGLGLMTKLYKNVWLDAAVQWQSTVQGGKFVNTTTVSYAVDGSTYLMQDAPAGMLLFKLGFSFRTASDNESAEFTSRRMSPSPLNEF